MLQVPAQPCAFVVACWFLFKRTRSAQQAVSERVQRPPPKRAPPAPDAKPRAQEGFTLDAPHTPESVGSFTIANPVRICTRLAIVKLPTAAVTPHPSAAVH